MTIYEMLGINPSRFGTRWVEFGLRIGLPRSVVKLAWHPIDWLDSAIAIMAPGWRRPIPKWSAMGLNPYTPSPSVKGCHPSWR